MDWGMFKGDRYRHELGEKNSAPVDWRGRRWARTFIGMSGINLSFMQFTIILRFYLKALNKYSHFNNLINCRFIFYQSNLLKKLFNINLIVLRIKCELMPPH